MRGIDWTAAILVGGHATRMDGADKAALTIGGQTILDRQLTVLRALTPHLVIVARNAATYCHPGVPIVADHFPITGPMGALNTALVEARKAAAFASPIPRADNTRRR